jgi:hypothetical protein
MAYGWSLVGRIVTETTAEDKARIGTRSMGYTTTQNAGIMLPLYWWPGAATQYWLLRTRIVCNAIFSGVWPSRA